ELAHRRVRNRFLGDRPTKFQENASPPTVCQCGSFDRLDSPWSRNPLSAFDHVFGEEKAHSCAIALRQRRLRSTTAWQTLASRYKVVREFGVLGLPFLL